MTVESKDHSSDKNTIKSPSEITDATSLKDEGNRLFRKGQLTEALLKYQEAIDEVQRSLNDAAGQLLRHLSQAACMLSPPQVGHGVAYANAAVLLKVCTCSFNPHHVSSSPLHDAKSAKSCVHMPLNNLFSLLLSLQ